MTKSAVTQALDRLIGYRDEDWTNWYRSSVIIGILTLGYMRVRLNKSNLKSTYSLDSGDSLFQSSGARSSLPALRRSRTAVGSRNNVAESQRGLLQALASRVTSPTTPVPTGTQAILS